MEIKFRSDNTAGASTEVMAGLSQVNVGTALAYGEDEISERLSARFAEIFETRVSAFVVSTGTAANAIGLAAVVPPFRSLLCHWNAHIYDTEGGAVEFFTQGARLVPLHGQLGKIEPTALASELAAGGSARLHSLPAAALSLTNLTECGTAYSVSEIEQLARTAREHNLHVHLDGARLANAVVSLGCTPAELTWRSGVEILSFGAIKNGTIDADAIVVFNRQLAMGVTERLRRAGQRIAKARFLSAQIEAYLSDELWLRNARQANRMACRLAKGIERIPGAKLHFPVDGNIIFVSLPTFCIEALRRDGMEVWHRNVDTNGAPIYRLVTSFETSAEEVDGFLNALGLAHETRKARD
jgi:threonine aldolase